MKLADEFVLLALRPDGKSLIRPDEIAHGAAAATLADLELTGRVRIEHGRVEVVNPAPIGDPELDGVLAQLAASGRPGKVHRWIGRLSRSGLYGRLLNGLVDQGVLSDGRRGLFRRVSGRGLPAHDTAPGQDARVRLQSALASDASDGRTVALLAIAHASHLDRALSLGVDKRELKERVAARAGEHWSIKAVRKSIGVRRAAIISANSGGVARFGG